MATRAVPYPYHGDVKPHTRYDLLFGKCSLLGTSKPAAEKDPILKPGSPAFGRPRETLVETFCLQDPKERQMHEIQQTQREILKTLETVMATMTELRVENIGLRKKVDFLFCAQSKSEEKRQGNSCLIQDEYFAMGSKATAAAAAVLDEKANRLCAQCSKQSQDFLAPKPITFTVGNTMML